MQLFGEVTYFFARSLAWFSEVHSKVIVISSLDKMLKFGTSTISGVTEVPGKDMNRS